jgi:hypothetical protein
MEVVARRVASIAALALFVVLGTEPSARASDAEVTADATAQFYDVRSPTGQTVLMRRRLTATLGVGEYNIFDAPLADPHEGEVDFRARLRYDADYGVSCGESSVPPASSGCPSASYGSFVPGAAQSGVDLMYAYLEGRRFFSGLLGFKLGRQYQTDVLGWWSFDGGELSVALPFYVKAEVYAGLEQRGGLPLSTSRFEADGVWRGDRTNFDGSAYPDFQPSAIAPAIGVALETTGVTWIHGRLSYRRVYDTGSSNVTEFTSGLYTPAQYGQGTGIFPGMRTSSDRLGYAVDTSFSSLGGLKAGIIYDFYNNEVTTGYVNLDAYLGTKVTLGLDYDYYVPSFDADSIWNFFAAEPRSDFGLRGTVDVDKKLSFSANAHARMLTVQTAEFTDGTTLASVGAANAYFPSNGHPFDEGGDLTARWRNEETKLGLNARGDFGDEGDRVGADVSAQHVFESRYVLAGRVGLWGWDDKLQPDRSTTSVQGVASLGYRFMPRSQGSVEGECDDNSIAGLRFRLMLLLSLGLTK